MRMCVCVFLFFYSEDLHGYVLTVGVRGRKTSKTTLFGEPLNSNNPAFFRRKDVHGVKVDIEMYDFADVAQ